MRLLAAVLPPARAVDELGRAVRQLGELPGAQGLRWTGREAWHLTLAFYGETDEAVLPELCERLRRAARRTGPFTLRLHAGGRFDGRALWAGVAGGIDTLRLLAERTDAAARRSGIAMTEHRRYVPHLTLARSGTPVDLGPYVAGLAAFEGSPWQVAELALIRSTLPRGGTPKERPRYETVARWPLGPGG
ncbi:RNA 2',3'-cyclic phosphodiesterase [Streptomyces sp. NPDC048416]|uniref:RNA 2',3'-cyclic phosphodiesterase n=1 Tax=Streptomyces sp. NPDC048416 TaxID=3365546 RepID=UPI00371AB988